MNLMNLKTIKYACIYALKSDKICIKICSKKYNFGLNISIVTS